VGRAPGLPHSHAIPGTRPPRHCAQCGGALELRSLKAGEPDRHVCPACGEVHWLDPKLAVGTLFTWQGGLVLLRRAIEPGYGKWVFPGGFVDRGETVQAAAAREAREEACVVVGRLELLSVFSYDGHPVVLVTFAGEIESGTPAAGDEALELRAFPLDRLPLAELAFRSTSDAVADYLRRRAARAARAARRRR
jgi:ADP-ribose pyrophosphatase YjhB (NUDIX family)